MPVSSFVQSCTSINSILKILGFNKAGIERKPDREGPVGDVAVRDVSGAGCGASPPLAGRGQTGPHGRQVVTVTAVLCVPLALALHLHFLR